MDSLCTLLGLTRTRTAPYRPESDGMIERFNQTCLMMFVDDRRDNWNELLPYVMNAYRTELTELYQVATYGTTRPLRILRYSE